MSTTLEFRARAMAFCACLFPNPALINQILERESALDAFAEKGRLAWAGVPDNWLRELRGGDIYLDSRHSRPADVGKREASASNCVVEITAESANLEVRNTARLDGAGLRTERGSSKSEMITTTSAGSSPATSTPLPAGETSESPASNLTGVVGSYSLTRLASENRSLQVIKEQSPKLDYEAPLLVEGRSPSHERDGQFNLLHVTAMHGSPIDKAPGDAETNEASRE